MDKEWNPEEIVESADISPYEQDQELLDWPEDLLGDETFFSPISTPTLEVNEHTSPEEVLKHYWGYSTFRPLQREIIDSVLSGKDTMGLLPTGGGKSITFQVPGLMLPGLTLVVTPLISLMKDQVDRLRSKGIKTAAIHSGMQSQQITQTLDNCIYGKYKFLYVSPERLASPFFRSRIEALSLSLLVIDECHCICQWGYDFRPSYLNILEIRDLLPSLPVLALTATAPPKTIEEIQSILRFSKDNSNLFQSSFIRPNLSYSVRYTMDKGEMLLHILDSVPGSAIIYCRNREATKDIAKYLISKGERAAYFHAGLSHAERSVRQTQWMQDDIRIIVATNAFGMGIDKPNVRLVVHMMMPTSLEEYFQEAGRAGRDGLQSYAVALVDRTDESKLYRRLSDTFPTKDYVFQVYEKLCNFFRIGEGEGFNHSYSYDEAKFFHLFRMRPIQTRSAIEIMQASGFLEVHRETLPSRIMILVSREELYDNSVGMDQLLRYLLRMYTGLFADYVMVSEEQIAQVSELSLKEVYLGLQHLRRIGIIDYIPQNNLPRITFRIRREDVRYLRIPTKAYEERRDRMQERLSATINYIGQTEVCRSQYLIRYFGEESPKHCGICDVCLKKTESGLPNHVLRNTERVIEELWEAEGKRPLSLEEINQKLGYTSERIERAVIALAQETDAFYLMGAYVFTR